MTDAGEDALSERLRLLDRVLLDPPRVHYMSVQDVESRHQSGVWSTERSCYELLAGCCPAGSRTLETGSGLSTILFAGWGAHHLCVTPGQEEADAIVVYCRDRDIRTDRLTFDVRPTDVALPELALTEIDVVLIDGGHGFPMPMIDWYFACRRLRRGGVLVVDDLQLPAVEVLTRFIRADQRWRWKAGTEKWAAFERLADGELREDWYMQPFYAGYRPTLLARAEMRVRHRLSGLRPRLRRALKRG